MDNYRDLLMGALIAAVLALSFYNSTLEQDSCPVASCEFLPQDKDPGMDVYLCDDGYILMRENGRGFKGPFRES